MTDKPAEKEKPYVHVPHVRTPEQDALVAKERERLEKRAKADQPASEKP